VFLKAVEVSLNPWAGIGLHEFILSGYPAYPLLEEAYTFGEGVIPILGERGLLAAPGPRTSRIRQEV
jgi:alkanesulfonate monooxygenase